MTSQIQRSIPSPFSPVRLWTENSKSDLIGTAIAAPWPFCWLTSKDVSPFHLTHLLWIERAIGYCASRDAAAARAPYRGRRPRRARASDTTMFVFHRGLAQVILKYQNMFIFITIQAKIGKTEQTNFTQNIIIIIISGSPLRHIGPQWSKSR